jgi:hypothetical protein
MVDKDLKVTLETDRTAVAAGGKVLLKAVIASPTAERNFDIKFDVSQGHIELHPGEPTTATWSFSRSRRSGRPPDVVEATVRLTRGQQVLAQDQRTVLLVHDSTLPIDLAPPAIAEGGSIDLSANPSGIDADTMRERELRIEWDVAGNGTVQADAANPLTASWDTDGVPAGSYPVKARLVDNHGVLLSEGKETAEIEVRPFSPRDTLRVNLRRSATAPTRDQALWVAVRNRTRAIAFSGSGYRDFIDRVLCKRVPMDDIPGAKSLARELRELGTQVHGVAAYELLKTATEVFLLLECGVAIRPEGALHNGRLFYAEEEAGRLGESVSLADLQKRLTDYLGTGRLPYIERVINAAFPSQQVGNVHCAGVLTTRADCPCLLELIWSYWHEEGMLAQTINAISRRFQNIRGPGDRDPLAHLELDPLRPLNNLLWGYVQDETSRLTLKRRAYEYDHHYGLTLYGKAVPQLRPADSRSKFLEGFHNLLHLCSVFYKEDNDTTVIADGFPLLNALKEVHLLLAQGAHNQFGDLPWTARGEMLIQQWLLARPEMREFLQSRPMVPYKEGWMPQVDTMKTLQGWSDITVTHFRDLSVYGEQILLTIRYGDWIDANDEDSAKNWARYWRPEIQAYLHAYRAVTGVDLTNPDTVDYTLPGVLLQKRLAVQRAR